MCLFSRINGFFPKNGKCLIDLNQYYRSHIYNNVSQSYNSKKKGKNQTKKRKPTLRDFTSKPDNKVMVSI